MGRRFSEFDIHTLKNQEMLNKFLTVSVGIAPLLSHLIADSSFNLISAGVVNGL